MSRGMLLMAAAAAAGAGIVLAASPPLPAEAAPIEYACQGGEAISVRRSGASAIVDAGGTSHRLTAKGSSIGNRFSSKQATLIIDGEFAVLVTRNGSLRCFETQHVAERG